MSLNIPSTIQEIYTKLGNDVKNLIDKSNPFLNKSLIKAELTAFAGRIYDVYQQINALIDESFDDTRTGDFLIREASDYGITIKAATAASGTISVVGTVGSVIPDETEFAYNDYIYISDGEETIASNTDTVSLSYVDTLVTCIFSSDHNMGNGQEITIAGASEPALNDTFEITVIDSVTVQFVAETVGTAADSATATFVNAVVSVISDGYGEDYNRNQGEVLEISTSIVGVTSQAVVTPDGIGGGTDLETDESLRSRLQFRKKNPAAFFNSAEVETRLREISWVDRVFIERVTPDVGEATIYLLKADNEIPSAAEISQAEDYFEPYLPINCDYTNIFIEAPTGFDVDFTFTAIDPDTSTMREAIEDNLEAFFLDKSNVGEDISEDQYRAAIINTVDPSSLAQLESFTLSEPSGDISASGGNLAVLGTITFS